MDKPWWRRRQPLRVRLFTIGCCFLFCGLVGPPILRLFLAPTNGVFDSPGLSPFAVVGAVGVVFSLVLIARHGWSDTAVSIRPPETGQDNRHGD